MRALIARRYGPAAAGLASNGGWMMAEQMVRLLVGMALSVWVARLLGPGQFGALSFAMSFSSLFGIVATLGLNRILVRELVSASANPDRARRLMSTAFAMRLAAACVMYAGCMLAAWASGQANLLLIGLLAGSFFFSASDCVDFFFQAGGEAATAAKARLLSFAAVSLVRIALLVARADVAAFAAVALLEYAAAAGALQIAFRFKHLRFSLDAVDRGLARAFLRESWPEIAAGFSGLLFVRIDQIMLEHMLGPEAVGTFAVAARLSEAWYFIPTVIVASTFPGLVASREDDERGYMAGLQVLMLVLCAVSYAAAATATLLAEPVIRILFGQAYQASAAVLAVLIWSGMFVSLGLVSGSWIVAEKKVRLNLYRNCAGLAANVLLNFLLIPRLGAVGAACATLTSLAVAYLLFDLFVPSMRALGWRKWRALLIVPALVRR